MMSDDGGLKDLLRELDIMKAGRLDCTRQFTRERIFSWTKRCGWELLVNFKAIGKIASEKNTFQLGMASIESRYPGEEKTLREW